MITTEKKIIIVQSGLLLFVVISFIYAAYYSVKRIKYKALLKLSLIISVIGVMALIDMYLVEPNWIKVEHVRIYDNDLAQNLSGMKVLQISDLHVHEKGFRERQLIKKINQLKPDILLITGDLFVHVDGLETVYEFEEVAGILENIKATYGIYGVLGNYDRYLRRHPDRIIELRKSGLNILDDESKTIDIQNMNSITIVGTEYSYNGYDVENKFSKSIENVPPHSRLPVILLNHYPDVFSKAHKAGVNLVLVGHTHGGQVGIPLLIKHSNTANKSEFMHGLYDSGRTKMYVNQGIGTNGLPIRFYCRPEITVFEFTAGTGN